MKHTTKHNSQGFTVVEVMVAMLISLVLLLGVINIFQASKTSHTLQSGVARLQENARFALDVMTRSIQLAGMDADDITPTDPFNTTNTTNGAGTASDSIAVQYASTTDCMGNATGGTAIDRFYISGTSLMCAGNGGAPAALVDGVDNMQILYGEDSVGTDGIADKYINAASVTQWTDDYDKGGITSVRIAILVSTVDNVKTQVNTILDTNTYNLLDAPTLGPFSDFMVRRVFSRTILLRNYVHAP